MFFEYSELWQLTIKISNYDLWYSMRPTLVYFNLRDHKLISDIDVIFNGNRQDTKC